MDQMIKVGDRVKLKSGGPEMVVTIVGHHGFRCEWTAGGEIRHEFFSAASIVRTTSSELPDGERRVVVPVSMAERIARVCHEANRAYCAAMMNDDTQVAWEDAPQWQCDSAIAGVQHALDNPNAPPSASHESWLAVKKAEGWKYGEVKDAARKEHPCFVPYDALPKEQQRKDALFLAVVKALT